MANQNVTAALVPTGVNRGNLVYGEVTLGTATAADTVTVTLPGGIDPNMLPLAAVGVKGSTTAKTFQALTLTSWTSDTGILVITVPSGGSFAAGDKIAITYLGG